MAPNETSWSWSFWSHCAEIEAIPGKSVPPQADFSRALKQVRAARGVTQEDMLSTTTRAQQVADAPLPATSHAVALLHEAETLEAISTLLAQVNRRGFW